ncbi:DNA-binding MarR family transcriptional regulator [Actinoplanes octamycinicus]|uniref:DNA-binding MarR family transcriptional regulator n=1 Tax=Actinoplanes octamycinicus TaxID=135948 RepID=A0A7W7M716_9ACTN|nr:transcriptional regulator [Actinoplanes octamycinicus]MBB4739338.1 DNA-binding MarR family transcriptional regulator [Actinoplanes octamycinicus]GIE58686.1 transcriptional regulator [Actinoplanes octamycinicus]
MTDPVPHPALELDEWVHQKTRLALLTVLDEAGRADFPYLKRLLGLSDGNLGRHLGALAAQSFVEIAKGHEGRRPRTWAAITPAGRAALGAEMAILAELLERFNSSRDGKK